MKERNEKKIRKQQILGVQTLVQQNDLQGRDGRCYYHEVLLFQGKEEWKKEWKKNKNLRLQTNIVPEPSNIL